MNSCKTSVWIRTAWLTGTVGIFCLQTPAAFAGSAVPAEYYGVWDRSGENYDADPALPQYDYLLGLSVGQNWSEIQPVSSNQYDWSRVETQIQLAGSRNQMVYFSINPGPDAPDWIYEDQGGGVPKVFTTTSTKWPYYPYYQDPDYRTYFSNMVFESAAYLRTHEFADRVAFIQVKTGCTGDEVAYKGDITEPAYDLPKSGSGWRDFRLYTFELYRQAFLEGTNGPPIPLLFNSVEASSWPNEWAWIESNIGSGFGVKGSAYVRGHHLTGERTFVETWKPYMVNPQGLALFSRAEMDQSWTKPFFQLNVNLSYYWGAISGLNQGLSVWDHSKSSLIEAGANTSVQQTLRFFNKYANQIYPSASTNAFIALHEGLDSSDTDKFPEATYGSASKGNEARYEAICNDPVYAARGAKMGDTYAATKGQVYQRSSQTNFNDAGWEIWSGNYSRFITQIDPDNTSIGLFRVGGPIQTNSPIYGRFARSFENAGGKNAMYFDCHDDLFADPAEQVLLSVIYYDAVSNSTWDLRYDAGTNGFLTALSVTGTGDATWKTVSATLTNAVMQNNGPNGADFALVNTDALDDIFHLIEVQRSARTPVAANSTLFYADFSDSQLNTNIFDKASPVPDPYGGLDNLNAGTAIGSWSAAALEESSIYTNESGNQMLFAGTGAYELQANVSSPAVISNEAVVSLDFSLVRTGAGVNKRNTFTGYDPAGQPVFRLWLSGNSLDDGGKTLYLETAVSTNLLATNMARRAGADFTDSQMDALAVQLNETGIEISLNSTVLTNGVPFNTPGAEKLAWLTFEGDSTFYDNIKVISYPTAYGRWAFGYKLTGGPYNDDDGNGLINLYEFGLGGNPTNPADYGYVPSFGINGTGIEYIHAKRTADSGLLYYLETTGNLISNDWKNTGYSISGTGTINGEFDAVTNLIAAGSRTRQFIRLVIEED